MIKTPEKEIYKGEGGAVGGYRGGRVQRWRGTEVARYRRWRGTEGARIQKAGGFRRRGEVLEWRERRLNWRWGRVELKRWLLSRNIRV